MPPNAVQRESTSSLCLAIESRNLTQGSRAGTPTFFPDWTFEIDYLSGQWKQQHAAQRFLDGVDFTIRVERQAPTTDVVNWSGRGSLVPDTRWVWRITLDAPGEPPHFVDFAVPTRSGEYLTPFEIVQFYTEAFKVNPGLWRIFLWDLAVQQEGSPTWIPLWEWTILATDMDPADNSWGHKRSLYNGQPVIEVSNDGTLTYLRKDEMLIL